MPVDELLLAGSKLMLLGMGVVFSFLTLLVFALRAMSAIARRIEARVDAPDQALPIVEQSADLSELAAVAAAVRLYRKRHQP